MTDEVSSETIFKSLKYAAVMKKPARLTFPVQIYFVYSAQRVNCIYARRVAQIEFSIWMPRLPAAASAAAARQWDRR